MFFNRKNTFGKKKIILYFRGQSILKSLLVLILSLMK